MKLCFRKYCARFILFAVATVLTTTVSLLIVSVVPEDPQALLLLVVSLLVLAPFTAYNLICWLVYRKIGQKMQPQTATVVNWQCVGGRGFNRTANISIKIGEEEYFSPGYFSAEEARDMVGRTISYVLADHTVLVYEVLDEA